MTLPQSRRIALLLLGVLTGTAVVVIAGFSVWRWVAARELERALGRFRDAGYPTTAAEFIARHPGCDPAELFEFERRFPGIEWPDYLIRSSFARPWDEELEAAWRRTMEQNPNAHTEAEFFCSFEKVPVVFREDRLSDIPLPYLSHCRSYLLFLLGEFRLKFEEGDPAEALVSWALAGRIILKLYNSPLLLDRSNAEMYERSRCKALGAVDLRAFSCLEIQSFKTAVENNRVGGDLYLQFISDYIRFSETIENRDPSVYYGLEEESGMTGRLGLSWPGTLSGLAGMLDYFRGCARLGEVDWFEAKKRLPKLPEGFWRIQDCTGLFCLFSERRAWRRVALTALAAEQFRRLHARLPEDLEELVPAFLDAVPVDPFDGRALRYLKDGAEWKIYSIGKDETDSGGDAEADIVFALR